MFFQPATFENFDDWRVKSSPKELKFCRHDHKGLVNMSTEGIDESLHGLGGIEEFRAKTGLFFRTPRTFDSSELVIPGGLALG